MNPLTQSKKTIIRPLLIALGLVCFALSPRAQAVLPAPDGGYPGGNTAEGTNALFSRTSGLYNTATGLNALLKDTSGSRNTANGVNALRSNTTGSSNTAVGTNALFLNSSIHNTAIGDSALFSNTIGVGNTAVGYQSLFSSNFGSLNTAIGNFAGIHITGDGNVCIGGGVGGNAGVSNTTWIRNVYASEANARAVYVNADGKLGTLASSRRFKKEIKPMDQTSEAILAFKPVTFHYKSDNTDTPQFGLIAEEVAEINPGLVVRNENGEIYTVRYEAVNAMLLNEFLKEHKKVEELEGIVTSLVATVKEQAAQIQKVSAQLEVNKTARQIVLNNQ